MAVRQGEQELFSKTRPRTSKGSEWPMKRRRHNAGRAQRNRKLRGR